MTPSLPRLQLAVFALVWAAFAVIYLTQPVLPVLRQEFGVELVVVSLSVSAAVGLLNTRLSKGHGHANALCVLFYYLGGWTGITCCGFAYQYGSWNLVLVTCLLLALVPLFSGLVELRSPPPRLHRPENLQ